MVHQHVALAQRREHALGGLALAESGVGGRHERPVLQIGPVDVVHLPQTRQVQQSRQLHHVGGIDVQLAQQQFEHVLGHVVGDLEAHRGTETATGEFPLECLQEVLVAVLLDLEVGVAGDPEGVVLDDLHPREQHVEVCRDEFFERKECVDLVR